MMFLLSQEAFQSVSARFRAKSMTRRAETGSFSASARRVILDQGQFSFHWLRPKVVNSTTQVSFWMSFLLRLVVSHMFPSQIFIELCRGWVLRSGLKKAALAPRFDFARGSAPVERIASLLGLVPPLGICGGWLYLDMLKYLFRLELRLKVKLCSSAWA